MPGWVSLFRRARRSGWTLGTFPKFARLHSTPPDQVGTLHTKATAMRIFRVLRRTRSRRSQMLDETLLEAREWLISNGVPHFAPPYNATRRWARLGIPLFVLVAFEVGLLAWLPSTLRQLLTAPPLLLFVILGWGYRLKRSDSPADKRDRLLNRASYCVFHPRPIRILALDKGESPQ